MAGVIVTLRPLLRGIDGYRIKFEKSFKKDCDKFLWSGDECCTFAAPNDG